MIVGGNETYARLVEGEQSWAVVIDGTPLLGFTLDQGNLLLTLRVFDDDGELVLCIEDNALVYSVTALCGIM